MKIAPINGLLMTTDLPDEPGYYWWTNFGEHTPCVLSVENYKGGFYASNQEYSFPVDNPKIDKRGPKTDGYPEGTELWAKIPNPILPNGKVLMPDCY